MSTKTYKHLDTLSYNNTLDLIELGFSEKCDFYYDRLDIKSYAYLNTGMSKIDPDNMLFTPYYIQAIEFLLNLINKRRHVEYSITIPGYNLVYTTNDDKIKVIATGQEECLEYLLLLASI